MMRRCVQNPLQRPALPDQLRVDPKLIQEIELHVDQGSRVRNARESQGKVKHEGEIALEHRLTESSGEVVVFRGMMDLVARPDEVYLLGEKWGKGSVAWYLKE